MCVSTVSGSHIWRPEKDVCSVPVSLFLPYFFEKGFLTNLELHSSGKAGWLVSPGDLSGSYFPMLGL